MKLRHQATGLVLTAALAVSSLNSCYFNSAGHLFDKASHKAAVVTTDLGVGGFVYTDGSSYYIELPRYKTGAPVKTQYTLGDQEQTAHDMRPVVGETCMVRIPREYAMFLTGQADGPTTPSNFSIVEDGHSLKSTCSAIPVTNTPSRMVCNYTHTSPNAAWWYTLGVFDWLCVDLPVTCVENSLIISLFALVILAEMGKDEKEKTAPTTTTTTTVIRETTTTTY